MAENDRESSAGVAALLSMLEGRRAAGGWVPPEYVAFRAWYQQQVGALPPPVATAEEPDDPDDCVGSGAADWQTLLGSMLFAPADGEDDDLD